MKHAKFRRFLQSIAASNNYEYGDGYPMSRDARKFLAYVGRLEKAMKKTGEQAVEEG